MSAKRRSSRRCLAAIYVAVTLTGTACTVTGPAPGVLEVTRGEVPMTLCVTGDADVGFIIGIVEVTNTGETPVTTTGANLVGEGDDWELIEAAIMPQRYENADGRTQRTIGAGNYPPASSDSIMKWHEAREPVENRVIEPGETVNLAYRGQGQPGARIDYSEWTYEDESGDEHVVSDLISIDIDRRGTGCDAA